MQMNYKVKLRTMRKIKFYGMKVKLENCSSHMGTIAVGESDRIIVQLNLKGN